MKPSNDLVESLSTASYCVTIVFMFIVITTKKIEYCELYLHVLISNCTCIEHMYIQQQHTHLICNIHAIPVCPVHKLM